jgi:hypothetical protein
MHKNILNRHHGQGLSSQCCSPAIHHHHRVNHALFLIVQLTRSTVALWASTLTQTRGGLDSCCVAVDSCKHVLILTMLSCELRAGSTL